MRLTEIATLPGHEDAAWGVSFNPQRNLLATCGTDRTIRLYTYSTSSGTPEFQFHSSVPTGHRRTIRAIDWHPTGSTLASASFDSTVCLWEDEDAEGQWECVTTLEGHENECKSVGFSSDGALIASCSRDRSVWVWEVGEELECIAVMMDHSADVKAVAWHPVEEILASASYDSFIHIMYDDPDSDWFLHQKLKPALPKTEIAALLSEARTEAERSEDALDVPPLQEPETVWCLAWSPDGKYLVSGGDSGGIRLWRRRPGTSGLSAEFEETLHVGAHAGPVYSIDFLAPTEAMKAAAKDGSVAVLASTGGDGRIIVWNASNEDEAECEDVPRLRLEPVAVVSDAHGVSDVNSLKWNRKEGQEGVLASCADDGSVKVWKFEV